jgi:hypothetical protein
VPFDPQAVLSRFARKTRSRPGSSGSGKSAVSASDWTEIRRLLKQVVANTFDEHAKKLTHTIHVMSVRNQLLQHENKQLQEALDEERGRKHQDKALSLPPAPPNDGGAMCWSPSKVAEARELQAQKQLEEERLQHQKLKATRQRDENKLQRELAAKQKREEKQRNAEVAAANKATKAAQREENKVAKQVEKQLQNDMSYFKKANRKPSKPPRTKTIKINQVLERSWRRSHRPPRQ